MEEIRLTVQQPLLTAVPVILLWVIRLLTFLMEM